MKKENLPCIRISEEMLQASQALVELVRVNRTIASPFDTQAGILGEMAFAQWYYGDWRRHQVGANKGQSDFGELEVKTSAFPFSGRLHLLVREDYARKRKPRFYVQLILDLPHRDQKKLIPGLGIYVCGYATAAEVDAAPLKDFGSKHGGEGGYKCHYLPISKLRPVKELRGLLV